VAELLSPSVALDGVDGDFCRSLAAVVAWARICMIVKSDANTRNVFRTRSIEPSAARFEGDEVSLYGARDEMRREVWRVVAEREQHLEAFGVTLPPHDSAFRVLEENGGALVAYFPHQNLCDGAAVLSSDGFFDNNNVPPWDLWIDLLPVPSELLHGGHLHASLLVSWVPHHLVPLAQAGIDVNPEECILFATLPGS
jgi:hypothetical protein